MIRERVEVAAPVADSTALLAGGNTWSFPTGGEFSLRLGSAPGSSGTPFAASFQCGPVGGATLTLKFKGSREGETVTLPLDGRRVGEQISYYPNCPGGTDGFGPFHVVSYGRETIPLGTLAAGDVLKVTYRANGLAIPMLGGTDFGAEWEVVPGGVQEVEGYAWAPVGQLYASFETFFGRLAVPLPLAVDADTLTEVGGAARLTLGDTRIDGDSLVTFQVADTAWGGLRRDDGTTGAPLASVTVDADEARSGVLFVAGETLPESMTAVAVSASALGRDGALTFFVGPPIVSLALTAEHDSLAAGEDSGLTLDAENVEDDATITLSLSDASLGSLVVGGGPALGRSGSASVQVVLAQVPGVRFVAADPAPEAEAVVTITAESEDGTTATA